MLVEWNVIKSEKIFNSELDFITKEYNEIKLKTNTLYHKRLKYNNPEDFNKILKISSTDNLLKIKTPELKIEYKSSQYIKFAIETPSTEGIYNASIQIFDTEKKDVEEILKFVFSISNNE